MKYKVGDIIDFGGLKGVIESAYTNTKIGFSEENKREPVYTIIFKEVPESKIYIENGTNKEHIKGTPQKKRKSTGRKS